MPLPALITGLFGGKAKDIAATVTDGLDKLFTSKEEKLEAQLKIEEQISSHIEKMEELANTEVQMYLTDTQDARDANVKIQESDKSSWIAKNFAYLMDGFFVLVFGAMLFIIINKTVPNDNKELFYTAFGLLGGYVGTTVNFHRGTSIGSKSNGDALRKMIDKK